MFLPSKDDAFVATSRSHSALITSMLHCKQCYWHQLLKYHLLNNQIKWHSNVMLLNEYNALIYKTVWQGMGTQRIFKIKCLIQIKRHAFQSRHNIPKYLGRLTNIWIYNLHN
jgi:hypothetical protein